MGLPATNRTPPYARSFFSKSGHEGLTAKADRQGGSKDESHPLEIVQFLHEISEGEQDPERQEAGHGIGVQPHHRSKVDFHSKRRGGKGFHFTGHSGIHLFSGGFGRCLNLTLVNIVEVGGLSHHALVMRGHQQCVPHGPQFIEPLTEDFDGCVIQSSIGFVQNDEGGCWACKGR